MFKIKHEVQCNIAMIPNNQCFTFIHGFCENRLLIITGMLLLSAAQSASPVTPAAKTGITFCW